MLRTLLTLTFVLFLTVPARGQSRQIPAPPQDQPMVIHSASIHTVSGDVIEHGYIRFDGGIITHIGAGDAPQDLLAKGTLAFDADGLHVYPGLIASSTTLGLSETQAVDVTNDHTELGRLKPEVRAAVAVNPDSDLIPVTRANGILLGNVFPKGGLISGRCSTMRFDGWTWEAMAIDDTAGLVLNWPRTEPISAWWMRTSAEEQRKQIGKDLKAVETFFDEAESYVAAKDNDDTLRTDQRFEAMRDALSGDEPIFINANSSGQIESAVAWATRRGYRAVIVGGAHADRAMPLLKKHDIPVIISGLHRLPSSRHALPEDIFELPRRLYEGGVRFCIASGAETAHERHLNHNAATAAAYGLPKIEALRSVTQHAATILNLTDYGTLEVGKSATLIVTSGDPLEILSDTLLAFIDGRRIDLGDRQKSLYGKYRMKYEQLGILD